MVQTENSVHGEKMEMISNLVSTHRTTKVIPDQAFQVPEEIPSISLMTDRKVFRDSFGKPRWKAPKACCHAGVDEFVDE